MTEQEKWIYSLVRGDVVALIRTGGGTVIDKVTVERVTPQQIMLKSGHKFWKQTGKEVARSSYLSHHIEPLNPELREKIEAKRLAGWITQLAITPPPLHILRAMRKAASGAGELEQMQHALQEATKGDASRAMEMMMCVDCQHLYLAPEPVSCDCMARNPSQYRPWVAFPKV